MPRASAERRRGARGHDDALAVDGRRASRDRNLNAVVDALLDLFQEGNLRPGADEIAARSGLSRRSVFRYFDALDDLARVAIARQPARVSHLVEVPHRGRGRSTSASNASCSSGSGSSRRSHRSRACRACARRFIP